MTATVPLGDLVTIVSGFAFKSNLFNDEGRGLPLVRIRDVVRGFSETFYEGPFQDQFRVSNGAILVGMDGEFNLAKWAGGPALLNQRVCRIDVSSPKLSSDYLFWFLPAALKEIEARTAFVTVKHLSAKDIRSIEIPLPPLDEQRRIAAILDQADALRRKRREALAAHASLRSSLFEMTFGDLDRWPTVSIGELVHDTRIGLVRGAAEFGDGLPFPYVRMNAITRDGEIDASTIKTTDASEKDRAENSLVAGDFLFNTRNSKELVGKTAVWRGPPGALFNNNIMRIRFRGRTNAEFVQAAFSTKGVRHELEIRKSGTTSVFAVYWRDLKTLPIPLPPIGLQSEFATSVQRIEELKENGRRHLAHLDTLFASLQHRAFRGEL